MPKGEAVNPVPKRKHSVSPHNEQSVQSEVFMPRKVLTAFFSQTIQCERVANALLNYIKSVRLIKGACYHVTAAMMDLCPSEWSGKDRQRLEVCLEDQTAVLNVAEGLMRSIFPSLKHHCHCIKEMQTVLVDMEGKIVEKKQMNEEFEVLKKQKKLTREQEEQIRFMILDADKTIQVISGEVAQRLNKMEESTYDIVHDVLMQFEEAQKVVSLENLEIVKNISELVNTLPKTKPQFGRLSVEDCNKIIYSFKENNHQLIKAQMIMEANRREKDKNEKPSIKERVQSKLLNITESVDHDFKADLEGILTGTEWTIDDISPVERTPGQRTAGKKPSRIAMYLSKLHSDKPRSGKTSSGKPRSGKTSSGKPRSGKTPTLYPFGLKKTLSLKLPGRKAPILKLSGRKAPRVKPSGRKAPSAKPPERRRSLSDISVGGNTPSDLPEGGNTPSDTSVGENTPSDLSEGENTPSDISAVGKAPSDISAGENTPSYLSEGENTPSYLSEGENTPSYLSAGENTLSDLSVGGNTPSDISAVDKSQSPKPPGKKASTGKLRGKKRSARDNTAGKGRSPRAKSSGRHLSADHKKADVGMPSKKVKIKTGNYGSHGLGSSVQKNEGEKINLAKAVLPRFRIPFEAESNEKESRRSPSEVIASYKATQNKRIEGNKNRSGVGNNATEQSASEESLSDKSATEESATRVSATKASGILGDVMPAKSRPAKSRPAESRPAKSRHAGSRQAESRPAGSRHAGSRHQETTLFEDSSKLLSTLLRKFQKKNLKTQ